MHMHMRSPTLQVIIGLDAHGRSVRAEGPRPVYQESWDEHTLPLALKTRRAQTKSKRSRCRPKGSSTRVTAGSLRPRIREDLQLLAWSGAQDVV